MARDRFTIENQIRVLRFGAREMTQQDLADRVGVSRQTINAIEAAKYSPSLEVAFRIARVFEKPLDEVFTCVAAGR
ncbi:MAG: helix-turn-helix transcriptional regulator [Phycisphaerales bacterium]